MDLEVQLIGFCLDEVFVFRKIKDFQLMLFVGGVYILNSFKNFYQVFYGFQLLKV